MRLTEYIPEDFAFLHDSPIGQRVASLRWRPFVDYYYTNNPWCKLHLLTAAGGTLAGAIGVDLMRFAAGERILTLGFATNFHAAQPGAGGYLFLHWLKTAPHGLVFGGSEDTHNILRQQRWGYFPGVKTLVLNRALSAAPDEPMWRRLAKRVLTNLRQASTSRLARRITVAISDRLSVREERIFTEYILPATSPFSLRFAPTVDYLNWRYRTDLPFVRYRIFRLRKESFTTGYVVLNETPQRILVAQCDGESATDLAHGVVMSVAAATEQDRTLREVMLTSSHPEMQRIYQTFGFRVSGADRPFAVGSRRGPVTLPDDPSQWLVNYDWGDNGLRAPFLDQVNGASKENGPLERQESQPLAAARSGDLDG